MWVKNKMINYKLAKKLKDAGFPQKHYFGDSYYVADKNIPNIIHIHLPDAPGFYNSEILPIKVKIPTLSELIKVCIKLSQDGDFHLESMHGRWGTSTCWKHKKDEWENGDTPEESVANLWLKLNETKIKSKI